MPEGVEIRVVRQSAMAARGSTVEELGSVIFVNEKLGFGEIKGWMLWVVEGKGWVSAWWCEIANWGTQVTGI